MTERREFQPLQAVLITEAFTAEGVEFLFLGKGGAILLGFPGITQDVDVFVRRTEQNGRRIVAAMGRLGFPMSDEATSEILRGKDFVQVKTGPFDLDLIFAPDGIGSFEEASARRILKDGKFPVASLDDIIASKRAAGREKDKNDLPMLEDFKIAYERLNPRPLRSAWEIDRQKPL